MLRSQSGTRRSAAALARDRLGIKRFSADASGLLAFASEVKALVGLSLEGWIALWDYFTYKYVPSPKTIYSDVRAAAGARLIYDGTNSRIWRYWSPVPTVEERDPTRTRTSGGTVARRPAHMLADVPIGVFLPAASIRRPWWRAWTGRERSASGSMRRR
jgi:asparagine synthase (glutamine-hydrolysing)